MFKFALYLSKSFLFIWLTAIFGFLTLIGLPAIYHTYLRAERREEAAGGSGDGQRGAGRVKRFLRGSRGGSTRSAGAEA